MNVTFFLVLLALFIITSIVLAKKTAKTITNTQDYYLSNRTIGIINLALTFLATQLGGGAIIGAADAAYQYGWHALYYALGIALGLLLLAMGIGKRWHMQPISTVPEIFQKVYHDKYLYTLASLIYIITTFMILVAIAVATRKYLAALGLHHWWLFLAFWAALTYYTSLGGLKAVVKTDMLQISLVLLVFFAMFWILSPIDYTFLLVPDHYESIPWSSWLLMPMLITCIGQDMGQRCFAGRTAGTVTCATALAGLLLMAASFLPIYLGIVASQQALPVIAEQSILMDTVIYLTNPAMTAVFALAVLMAILSTADSLLCAISSNVALDFIRSNSPRALLAAKILTFIISMLAFASSYLTQNIIAVMVIGYGLTITSLFIPIMMALFFKNPSRLAAWLSFTAGLLSYVGFYSVAYKELLGLTCSLSGFLLGSIIQWWIINPLLIKPLSNR